MNTFRSAALAATAGVALMASSAHAATCYDQTVAAMGSFWPGGAASMTPAGVNAGIQKAGVSLLVQKVSPKVDESCRPHIADNANTYAGIGQSVEPVRAAPPPAPKPVVVAPPAPAPSATPTAPAQTGAPANAGSVGPGATIDRQIVDHERRITALEAGGGNPAEIAALRTEVADLRAQATRSARNNRDGAATRLQRTVTRPGVTRGEIAVATTALRQADEKLAEMRRLETAAKASADAAARSAASAADSASKAGDSAATAATSATTATAAATRAETAASTWSPWTWTWWDLIFAIALIALIVAALVWWNRFRKPDVSEVDLTGYATKEDLATKADAAAIDDLREEVHGRIDRRDNDLQLDEASLDAMKKATVGDEVEPTITENGEPTYRLKVTKISDDNFATVENVGDSTPAGQDIGDVIAFVRRAYKGRRNDLDAFKID